MSSENDLAQINNSIGLMVNEGSKISSSIQSMSVGFGKIIPLINDIIEIIDHFHKSHKHFVEDSHLAETFKTIESTIGGCIVNTFFENLGHELETVADLDYNSLIFGKDFKFDYLDLDLPRFMNYVQKESSIRYPILQYDFIPNDLYKDVPTITFSDWTKSVNLSIRNSPKAPNKKLFLQLLLNQNPDDNNSNLFDGNLNLDENGNIIPRPCSNLVYGYDFIIDPSDPQKPQELIDLEKDLNLPSDIQKIKYSDYLNNCIDPEYRKNIFNTSDNSSLDNNQKLEEQELNDYICTRLVAEWIHNTDIDKNGLIYGVDFIFRKNEPKKCKGLKDIELDLDWNPPENIKIWSYDKYCQTFPNNNPDDRYSD